MPTEEKKNLVDPFAYIKAAAAITIFLIHTRVFSSLQGYVITGANWYMKTAAHGAVWVFFFLSGYFNICGFLGAEPRYRLDLQGIIKFYTGRFFKVLLPVWCFYLIALVISEPAFLHMYPGVLFRLLTFTYTGEPGCSSIAATWYVSSLAWLYAVTPFAAWFCRKLEKINGFIHLFLFAFAGAGLGLMERLYLLWRGTYWTQGVFVPAYCNLDIYICGALAFMIAKRIRLSVGSRLLYASSIIVFSALLLCHSRINYLGDINGKYVILHEYLMPTVYILVMTFVCIMISSTGYRYLSADIDAIRKNPLRLIDAFSLISFQFYLVHSMVLFQLSPYIGGADGFQYNLRLTVAGFVISVLLSVLLRKATAFKVPGSGKSVKEGEKRSAAGRTESDINMRL